jgi:hypothetical protein
MKMYTKSELVMALGTDLVFMRVVTSCRHVAGFECFEDRSRLRVQDRSIMPSHPIVV